MLSCFIVSTPGGTVSWINIGIEKSPRENLTAIM
jgi:hypothetical protein